MKQVKEKGKQSVFFTAGAAHVLLIPWTMFQSHKTVTESTKPEAALLLFTWWHQICFKKVRIDLELKKQPQDWERFSVLPEQLKEVAGVVLWSLPRLLLSTPPLDRVLDEFQKIDEHGRSFHPCFVLNIVMVACDYSQWVMLVPDTDGAERALL